MLNVREQNKFLMNDFNVLIMRENKNDIFVLLERLASRIAVAIFYL